MSVFLLICELNLSFKKNLIFFLSSDNFKTIETKNDAKRKIALISEIETIIGFLLDHEHNS